MLRDAVHAGGFAWPRAARWMVEQPHSTSLLGQLSRVPAPCQISHTQQLRVPDAGLVTDAGLAALAALPLQDLDLSCRRVGGWFAMAAACRCSTWFDHSRADAECKQLAAQLGSGQQLQPASQPPPLPRHTHMFNAHAPCRFKPTSRSATQAWLTWRASPSCRGWTCPAAQQSQRRAWRPSAHSPACSTCEL